MFCLDTDVLSAVLRARPPLALIRKVAVVPANQQSTTSITVGELVYGARRRGSPDLAARVRDLIERAGPIHPFDADAAEVYGGLRADLEAAGKRLDEPDLRIASIALARDLILVSGNVRHFGRVPGLRLENWLT